MNSLAFAQGEIHTVEFVWDQPTLDVWTTNFYFLHFSLTLRPEPARATFLDQDDHPPESIGRVMCIPPGQTVRIGGGRGTQRSLMCVLKPSAVEGILGHQPEWNTPALIQGLRLNSPEVDWFMLKLHDEMLYEGFAQTIMADALASALAVALVRAFRLDEQGGRCSSGGLAAWRLRLIKDRVQSDEPLPHLAELAQLCSMSVRHLTRAFKAETGMTIAKHVESEMVHRARALLSQSSLPIDEIARILGFSKSSSFTQAFRRTTGMCPTGLRHRPSALTGAAR